MEDVYLTSPCLQIQAVTFRDYTTGLVLSCTHLCDMNQPDKAPECLERCPEFRQCLLSTTTTFEPTSGADADSVISNQDPNRGVLVAIFILSSAVIVIACTVFALWMCSRRRHNPGHGSPAELKDPDRHEDSLAGSSTCVAAAHVRYDGPCGVKEEFMPLNRTGMKHDETAHPQCHQSLVQTNVNHSNKPVHDVILPNSTINQTPACGQSLEQDKRMKNMSSNYGIEQLDQRCHREENNNVRISTTGNESHVLAIELPGAFELSRYSQ